MTQPLRVQMEGALFEAVQLARLFPDSKTFVDSIPKRSPESILELYDTLKEEPSFDLEQFVSEYFRLPQPAGSNPDLPLDTSSLESYIDSLWSRLRRDPGDVTEHDTLIRLNHPYIVPGGRFGEIYYWDSYFTFLGLVEAGYVDMVDMMVKNFVDLQTRLGLIPNGNRYYFATRSQPPYLSLMLRLLWDKKYSFLDESAGTGFLQTAAAALEKERSFWLVPNRLTVLANGSLLNHYWDASATPRQESYGEDVRVAAGSPDPETLYRHLRAGAESGWDFSSRWLDDPSDLSTIRAADILPVDLNCLLYLLDDTLADFHSKLGNSEARDRYRADAGARKDAVAQTFWNKDADFYVDFDTAANAQTEVFSLAAVTPLFAGIADQKQAESVRDVLMSRFLKDGGLVSTLTTSGQQWDAPNGWAPLQWLAVKGLNNYGFRDDAREIATRWLRMVRRRFDQDKKLLEKYDVVNLAAAPGGGEYEVQEGFGWTNGVTLKLLKMYGEA